MTANQPVQAQASTAPAVEPSNGSPTVSIIIPSYNHAQYVGDAIRSVLAQDFKDFEIIVVDDGSMDNTREVVAQFGERVRYIWQENQGLSAARNSGMQAAKGKYIGLLDADDMLEPRYLSSLLAILAAHPDAQGVFCGYQFVDQNNTPLYEIQTRQIPPERLYETILTGNPFVPESMFLERRCYLEAGPFDVTLKACEDWDLWLTISHQFRIVGTTGVLTRHRVLIGSMSSDPARMFSNRLAVVMKHFGPEPVSGEAWTDEQRLAYSGAYRVSCIEYLQCGDEARAYACFRKMAVINPAMLQELDTFYELGCGPQEKGFRGQLSNVDLDRNFGLMMAFTGRLFEESDLPGELVESQRRVLAVAYYAMGLLEYKKEQFGRARNHFLRSLRCRPGFIYNQAFLLNLVKSSLGGKFIQWFKHAR